MSLPRPQSPHGSPGTVQPFPSAPGGGLAAPSTPGHTFPGAPCPPTATSDICATLEGLLLPTASRSCTPPRHPCPFQGDERNCILRSASLRCVPQPVGQSFMMRWSTVLSMPVHVCHCSLASSGRFCLLERPCPSLAWQKLLSAPGFTCPGSHAVEVPRRLQCGFTHPTGQ